MIRCIQLANSFTFGPHGKLVFDAKGECRQLTPEQEQEYKNVRGFEIVEEKPEPKAKEEAPKEKPTKRNTKSQQKDEE